MLRKANARDVVESCPFNIPRVEKGSGYMSKCTMCVDRVHNGLQPACVKTCPTGAMNYGDRARMVSLANKRLAEAKSRYPRAVVTGLDDLRCFYLLGDEPSKYYQYASADRVPGVMDRKMALRKIGRSLKELSQEWNLLNKLVG